MMNYFSQTGIVIYFCRDATVWYSKKQNIVESSMFGSEIGAMRTEMDLTRGLHYKLRIVGFLINGPTSVFCDNKLVVTITSVPTSTLVKKYLGIFYHAVIEAVAAGIHQIVHIDGEYNPADVLTKILTASVKRPHIGRFF